MVAGMGSPASHPHVGCQPMVSAGCSSYQSCNFCPEPVCREWKSILLPAPRFRISGGGCCLLTCLSHGAPHFGQHPFSEVPARIARRGISVGNVLPVINTAPFRLATHVPS